MDTKLFNSSSYMVSESHARHKEENFCKHVNTLVLSIGANSI